MDAIVAVYSDWGIGENGSQPVVLRGDRAHFREYTRDAAVIVGRRTMEDFPGGRPLRGRHNIVLTRQPLEIEDAEVVHNEQEAVEAAARQPRCLVIGGASVYRALFPWLTRVVYACDQPNNLCPSLHVVCSYYCWRAIWDTEGIPTWYRRFNFVFLLLVCCSILFVKQHVLVDIPAGVLVSEIPLQLAKRFRWERLGYALEKRIEAKRANRR